MVGCILLLKYYEIDLDVDIDETSQNWLFSEEREKRSSVAQIGREEEQVRAVQWLKGCK